MKRDNRIAKRWIVPTLLLAVLAAVCAAAMMPQREAAVGGPQATRPPGQTAPAVTAGTQPSQVGTSDPVQTEPIAPPEDTQPEQTRPDGDDSPRETDPPEPTEPVKIAGAEDIVCREFARFSGQYVEDGRDELVENVAALLVTNRSDQFLDLATLTYDVDGRTATFAVTGLPSGRSAWVMEAERMVIPDDAQFTLVDCVTAFRENVTVDTDAVSIYAEANMLTAVNNTRETLEDVFVYYKTLHTDGNFFGGITYRVDFGTLEPGASAEALAGHYSAEHSELIRIGWVDQ